MGATTDMYGTRKLTSEIIRNLDEAKTTLTIIQPNYYCRKTAKFQDSKACIICDLLFAADVDCCLKSQRRRKPRLLEETNTAISIEGEKTARRFKRQHQHEEASLKKKEKTVLPKSS